MQYSGKNSGFPPQIFFKYYIKGMGPLYLPLHPPAPSTGISTLASTPNSAYMNILFHV